MSLGAGIEFVREPFSVGAGYPIIRTPEAASLRRVHVLALQAISGSPLSVHLAEMSLLIGRSMHGDRGYIIQRLRQLDQGDVVIRRPKGHERRRVSTRRYVRTAFIAGMNNDFFN